MTKTIAAVAVVGLFAGCAPGNMMRPTFPAVAPAKEDKSGNRDSAKEATSSRPPVTASQVNDRNAWDVAHALAAEIDQDAKK